MNWQNVAIVLLSCLALLQIVITLLLAGVVGTMLSKHDALSNSCVKSADIIDVNFATLHSHLLSIQQFLMVKFNLVPNSSGNTQQDPPAGKSTLN